MYGNIPIHVCYCYDAKSVSTCISYRCKSFICYALVNKRWSDIYKWFLYMNMYVCSCKDTNEAQRLIPHSFFFILIPWTPFSVGSVVDWIHEIEDSTIKVRNDNCRFSWNCMPNMIPTKWLNYKTLVYDIESSIA